MTAVLYVNDEKLFGTAGYIPADPNSQLGRVRIVLEGRTWIEAGSDPLYDVNVASGTWWTIGAPPNRTAWPEFDESLVAYAWLERRRIEQIADAWERDTRYLSTFRAAAQHEAFRTLSRARGVAIGVALDRLDGDSRPLWIGFLRAVVDEVPVGADAASVVKASTAWKQWGRENVERFDRVRSPRADILEAAPAG